MRVEVLNMELKCLIQVLMRFNNQMVIVMDTSLRIKNGLMHIKIKLILNYYKKLNKKYKGKAKFKTISK